MSERHTILSEAQIVALSRLLSRVLRHDPQLVGLHLDAEGWTRVDELLNAIRKSAHAANAPKRLRTLPAVTREALDAVVTLNDKQRFAFSADRQRIRAVQGHSVSVELGHPVRDPPSALFHGTAASNWPSIAAQGLQRGKRHAVHLSADVPTAKRVGARHGTPVVLEVAAGRMHRDGYEFTQADNGVWLVSDVPTEYLKRLG